MDNFILVSKDTINEHDISNDALCVYAAIYSMSYKQKELFISCTQIERILFKRPGSEKERKGIINGIKELSYFGYIKFIQKYKDNSWYCDVSSISIIENGKYYMSITIDELQKIMNLGTIRYNILRYFLILTGTFNISMTNDNKYILSSFPINYLSVISGLSTITINKYNKILKDNKIIYISRRRTLRNPNKGQTGFLVKWECNVYSRYENKDMCEKYVSLNGAVSESDQKKRELDESRRYIQLYNSMVAGKEYDLDLIKEIYEYIKDWNKRKLEKYEEDIANGKKVQDPKIKDLSIFYKYGLK